MDGAARLRCRLIGWSNCMISNRLRSPARLALAIFAVVCLLAPALPGFGSAWGKGRSMGLSLPESPRAQQDSAQTRREPPPFDRPPLGSAPRQSDSQRPADSNAGSDSSRDTNPGYQPPSSSSNKRPPVLRRSEDAAPEPARQKPT